MLLPILLLGGIWSAVGAAGGLAFGIGMGGRDRILLGALGGLVGAALGTILYEVLGAMAFPIAETGSPIAATSPTRLLGRVMVTLSAAAGAAIMIQGSPKSQAAKPEPTA